MNTTFSSRRTFLLSIAIFSLLGEKALANNKTNWNVFENKMLSLANANDKISRTELITQGLQYLKQLDIHSKAFKQAENASYESGNQYWLWQRMIKSQNINGGILNIENNQMVQLHDHPNAIGLLRIMSGSVEIWQYNETTASVVKGTNIAKLTRTSHKTLHAGDTAVLTPTHGNIHALQAISPTCRMLDFFIPPYKQSQRSWYEPLDANWHSKKNIICKKIPHYDYAKA